jgi:hypothetical protein
MCGAMDTFQQLRNRLRKSSQSPSMVCEILDDTLTALEQASGSLPPSRPVSTEGLPVQTFADAQAMRKGPPDLADAAAHWPQSPDDVERVKYEPAPVLPPGCKFVSHDLQRGAHGPISTIWGVHGQHYQVLARDCLSQAFAASVAWDAFGAFMSREDYEALEHDARALRDLKTMESGWFERPSDHMQAWRQALGAKPGESTSGAINRVICESKRLSSVVTRACEALQEAGNTSPSIAGGIRELSAQIGHVQAGEGYAREVAEQEAERLRTSLGTMTADRDLWLARAGELREARDTAEKRTEAHRLEIGRLTDTIQRLRQEVVEARAEGRRQGHREMGNG